jgi:hypothetical protein
VQSNVPTPTTQDKPQPCNTNNKMKIQLDTKSKHKPQAMLLAPCHMLHSLLINKHVIIQGIQGFKKTLHPKKTHEFQKRKQGIFIISVHLTLWIMQGTQQIGN